MTKATTAAKVTTVVTAAPATLEAMTQTFIDITKQPRTIQLSGMAYNAFSQAAALVRLGYVFDPAMPQQVFSQTGMAAFFMVLGTPDDHAVRGAHEAIADAAAAEEREYIKAVEAAAARLIDEREAAARKAEKDAEIAAAEAVLAALRKAAA